MPSRRDALPHADVVHLTEWREPRLREPGVRQRRAKLGALAEFVKDRRDGQASKTLIPLSPSDAHVQVQ